MSQPIRREDLISRQSAARSLGIHVNTFDRWAVNADLRRYKITGDSQLYFARAEIGEKYEAIVEVTT